MSSYSIKINDIENDVDKIINSRTVARISFKSVTPWLGGDASGNISENVKEDAITGRLRWFIRTVYNRFCSNDISSYNEAENFVSKILGSESNASNYSFYVYNIKQNFVPHQEYQKLNMYDFISSGKDYSWKSSNRPINNMSFELLITRNSDSSDYDKLVLDGTILTLAYIGIGRGANRGFGRFVPYYLIPRSNIFVKVKMGDVHGSFKEFYQTFNQTTKCSQINSWESSAVPLAPLTDGDGPDAIKKVCNGYNQIRILNAIFGAFLKSTIKKNQYGSTNYNVPGPFIHTWLYGLPRNSTRKQNNGVLHLGYFFQNERGLTIGRRSSMFVVSPVSLNNSNRYDVYLLPFLSLKDHEAVLEDLVHIGKHSNEASTHNINVKDIINRNFSGSGGLNQKEKTLADKREDLSYGQLTDLIKNYENVLAENMRRLC